MSQAPPMRRRWFQFGIGTMLLLMVIASLVVIIWRDRLELRRQQARHAEEIAREREISIRVEEEAHAHRRKAIAAEHDAMRLRQRTE